MEVDEVRIARGLHAATEAVRTHLENGPERNPAVLAEVAVVSFLTKMQTLIETQREGS